MLISFRNNKVKNIKNYFVSIENQLIQNIKTISKVLEIKSKIIKVKT